MVRPENHGSPEWVEAHEWHSCEAAASCLGWTERRHRGYTYFTGGPDAFLAGLIDYQSSAQHHPSFPSVASGVFRPLPTPVGRDRLLQEPELSSLFKPGRRVPAQRLTEERTAALDRIVSESLGAVPDFMLMPEEECSELGAEWDRVGNAWGLEKTMQEAIRTHGRAWRKLFESEPRAEVRGGMGRDRYDLVSDDDRVVAELKLRANTATLSQLDRYLQGKPSRGRAWRGHIVYGMSCTERLRDAVQKRGGTLALWSCEKGHGNRPKLRREA